MIDLILIKTTHTHYVIIILLDLLKKDKYSSQKSLPRALSCCFLLEPGGLPLAFFTPVGDTDPPRVTGEEETTPASPTIPISDPGGGGGGGGETRG
jgi:hypothetical protein